MLQSSRPRVRPLELSVRNAGWMAALACAAVLVRDAGPARAADARVWATTPYRMIVTVACDDDARPQPGLEANLAEAIKGRVDATLRPLWSMQLEAAPTPAARRECFDLGEIPLNKLSSDQIGADKLMWLGVRATIDGYELGCREFDVYLRRWGPIKRRTVAQSSYLADSCFELLTSTFAPLAMIEPIEEDDERVRLVFKGSSLPRRSPDDPFVVAGELYAPLLRRTDRSGKLMENGITPTPWTFLTIADRDADSKETGSFGTIHSGTRRPFGARPRGAVEQLAVAMRIQPGPTTVRFHARTDKAQGLAGYEVFRAEADGKTNRLGVTDRDGTITIEPSDGKVSMLLLRSDGQLLAKVPVPNGYPELLQTPIADNVTRLQAQAEAQVVREELVDLVARRAIMMGRVKSMLKNGRAKDAKELMEQLDALPSPSVFSRMIDNAARKIPPSKDPSVQKRIESLFSSTREMLSKFLSTRQITELQNEVNSAAEAAGGSAAAPSDAENAGT